MTTPIDLPALIGRLRENILADAFERHEIGGVLAERLMHERSEAADALEAALAVTEPFASLLTRLEADGDYPPIRPGGMEMNVDTRWLRAIRDWRNGIIKELP